MSTIIRHWRSSHALKCQTKLLILPIHPKGWKGKSEYIFLLWDKGPSSRQQKNEVSETNTNYSFLKKINSHIKSYSMLRTRFVSGIFLFDASLYFLCNLKINSVFHWVDIFNLVFFIIILCYSAFLIVCPSFDPVYVG